MQRRLSDAHCDMVVDGTSAAPMDTSSQPMQSSTIQRLRRITHLLRPDRRLVGVGDWVQGGASAVLKSAVISGSFCAAGDILSQIIASMIGDGRWKMDWMRVGRMTGFGLVFYGPFQHVWYRALDARFPRTIAADFMAKVVLNQIVLGPIVISTSFIWTMTLTNKMKELPVKFQRDFVATMTNGWKLWIPAAVANFKLIPIESQVLFMSFVSLCWTAYLGYQSNKNLTRHSIPATDEKA